MKQGRDYDGTPLYWLSWSMEQAEMPEGYQHWVGGFSKDSLLIIKAPASK